MKKYTTNKKTESPSVLNEAMVNYVRRSDTLNSLSDTTSQRNYENFFGNQMLIIHTIREGIPYKVFASIRQYTPFSDDDWAQYLHLSKKTLHRHSTDATFTFKPIHSEKIIELAEVTHYGLQVFDSKDQFYLWLNTPSFALGNLTPAELLMDSYGKDLVMGELNRIEHGIFA